MNAILAILVRRLQNPHTSIAGIGFFICKIGAIWLPKWKSQFDATEGICVMYGLFKSEDAKKTPVSMTPTMSMTPTLPPLPPEMTKFGVPVTTPPPPQPKNP